MCSNRFGWLRSALWTTRMPSGIAFRSRIRRAAAASFNDGTALTVTVTAANTTATSGMSCFIRLPSTTIGTSEPMHDRAIDVARRRSADDRQVPAQLVAERDEQVADTLLAGGGQGDDQRGAQHHRVGAERKRLR